METKANILKFRASTTVRIYVDEHRRFESESLANVVRDAIKQTAPWCSTHGRTITTYARPVYPHTRHQSGHHKIPLAFYEVWIHNGPHMILGPQQLFAYRCYIDSILKAIVDLDVPGIVIATADVQFSLKALPQSTSVLGQTIIKKGYL